MQAPWMTIAFGELGQAEISGPATNPRIARYLSCVGMPSDDTVPWCSAFANWCMRQAGLIGTGKANARSWMQWGDPISRPEYGCVVIFWRDKMDGPLGHVGFYVGESDTHLAVIGGNQGDRVSVALYPKSRVLGYRTIKPTV